jgi:hypothetical protein
MTSVSNFFIVIGYGSLMSGCGLFAKFRKNAQPLRARSAFRIWIENARRGYRFMSPADRHCTMDICDAARGTSISAARQPKAGSIGALALLVGRSKAFELSTREDFPPDQFDRLLNLADSQGQPVEEFLLNIAKKSDFDGQVYRSALEALLGTKLPPYLFYPVPFDDGQTGILAAGMNTTLWSMDEAIAQTQDTDAQLVYFAECLLAERHGIGVDDLMGPSNVNLGAWAPNLRQDFVNLYNKMYSEELSCFLEAISLSMKDYRRLFAPQQAIKWQ